jgi:hypothetical protein
MNLTIKKVRVCTAHQWYTPLDDGACNSHGEEYVAIRYEVVDRQPEQDYAVYRSNGDRVVYASRSGARYYIKSHS